MKLFLVQWYYKDNVMREEEVEATSRQAAFQIVEAQKIKPGNWDRFTVVELPNL